jgi:hypothetical protein
VSQLCTSCHEVIRDGAERCDRCKKAEEARRSCVVCRELLQVPGARRCNNCSTYQDRFWRHVPLIASAAPIVTVITAIVSVWFYFSEYHSDTHLKVATAESEVIYLKAWNTGRKPSVLLGARLVFDSVPDKQLTLGLAPEQVMSATNVIESDKPVMIELQQRIRESLPAAEKRKQYEPGDVQELRKDLTTQWTTLYVDVQESSDDPGEHHTRRDRFLADRISAFINGRWPLNSPSH